MNLAGITRNGKVFRDEVGWGFPHTPNPVTSTWISCEGGAESVSFSANCVAPGDDAGPRSPMRNYVNYINMKESQEESQFLDYWSKEDARYHNRCGTDDLTRWEARSLPVFWTKERFSTKQACQSRVLRRRALYEDQVPCRDGSWIHRNRGELWMRGRTTPWVIESFHWYDWSSKPSNHWRGLQYLSILDPVFFQSSHNT